MKLIYATCFTETQARQVLIVWQQLSAFTTVPIQHANSLLDVHKVMLSIRIVARVTFPGWHYITLTLLKLKDSKFDFMMTTRLLCYCTPAKPMLLPLLQAHIKLLRQFEGLVITNWKKQGKDTTPVFLWNSTISVCVLLILFRICLASARYFLSSPTQKSTHSKVWPNRCSTQNLWIS